MQLSFVNILSTLKFTVKKYSFYCQVAFAFKYFIKCSILKVIINSRLLQEDVNKQIDILIINYGEFYYLDMFIPLN